jgi:hypothetical protein
LKRINFICNDYLETKITEHNSKWGSSKQSVIEIALNRYFDSLEATDEMLDSMYKKLI